MKRLLIALMLLLHLVSALPVWAEAPVKFGVLAFRPKAQITAQWKPLAAYLEKATGRRVELTAYTLHELDAAVAQNALDVVLTNPGHYILLRQLHHLSAPLATQITQDGEHELWKFGGVIFTRADTPTINTLADLAGKRIAAVGMDALGGYQMQAFELMEADIPLPGKENLLLTGVPQDLTVQAVLDGRADAGFVRAGVLETMAREGKLDWGRIKIIHRQDLQSFPYASSTRLYPEWPVAVMPQVDEHFSRRLTVALLSLQPGDPAARAAGVHGFTAAAQYEEVEEVLRRLRMPPYDAAPEFTVADLWKKYAPWITTLGVLMLLLVIMAALLLALNRREQQVKRQLLISHDLLAKVNRALSTIKACNESLIRATAETDLLREICQLLIEKGGYRFASVGYAENGPGKPIRIVAHAGHDEGYVAGQFLTWAATPRGSGPSGTAVRSGKPAICKDIANDPNFIPWRDEALKRGFASSIALPLMMADAEPFGVLNIYSGSLDTFDAHEVPLLVELSEDLAYGITALRTTSDRDRIALAFRTHEKRLLKSLEDSIQAIAGTVETRDPYTAGHQQRVAQLAITIARRTGLSEDRIQGLKLAAVIHDLGKIGVPAEILSMPRPLNPIESELVKTHPRAGYEIIKDVEYPWPIAQIVLQHHERLDGSGYPQGLKGEEILAEAKILAVADVVEAMSSHRPYRAGLGIDLALEEITRNRGIFYDADVVDACIKLFKEDGFVFKFDS